MSEFTPTQGRYLSFIHRYTEGFGYPPAESEIAKAMKVSPPSVNQMMKTLQKKGLISRVPGTARSIEILVSAEQIPKWTKKITSTERVWMRVEPKPQNDKVVYRFEITLKNTWPAIWRQIETKDVTLRKLHELIQSSMGWEDSHLHCFTIGDKQYTDPRFMRESFDGSGDMSNADVRVSDLVAEFGKRMKLNYEYDYGDGWQHVIKLQAVTEAEPRVRYPRCIDGANACPPEDIGGVGGFSNFVEAITDPNHKRHYEFLEWVGPFDPEKFDAAKATKRMKEDYL